MKKALVLLILTITLVLCFASCEKEHVHDFGEWTVAENATCTNGGTEVRHCSCGEKQSNPIPATGHHYIDNVCESCGEVKAGDTPVDPEVPACTHSQTIITEAIAPTCTETGFTEGEKCSDCGEVLRDRILIDALGHTQIVIPAVESTCTQKGLTEGKKCSTCGYILIAQQEAPLKVHTEEIIPAVESTCTQKGLTAGKKCSICGQVLVTQQEAPLKAHTETIIPAVAATCTKTGLTEGKSCSVCGAILAVQQITPIIEHTYDDKYDESCNECGFIRDAECAHTNVTSLAKKDATCTETGLTEGETCAKCEKILVAQEVIPALGHTEVIDAAISASCTSTGLSEGKHCSVCSTIIIAQTVVDVLGHSEVIDAAVDPSYESTGLTEGKHCSVCNTVLIEQQIIPVLEPKYHSIVYRNIKNATYPSATSYAENIGLLDLPLISEEGYKFLGWYTKSSGGDLIDYIPAGSTQDYVLFAHWELVTYEITYKNVPNNTNTTTYDIEDKLKLETPKWSGLEFTHWSDADGNVYKPDENITFLPEKMTGDLVLTANWKVLRNIATPAEEGAELYNSFSAEDGFLYFFYDLGTIEHVVLDDIDPNLYYKAEGMPISLTLSKTVTISEEKAESISETVSKSISSTSSWEHTDNYSKTESSNWNAQIGGGVEGSLGSGALVKKVLNWEVKLKVEGHYNWGGSEDETNGWTHSNSGSSSESETTTNTVSSSIAYKNEITSEIIENYNISADLPSGYYAYVHAGNVRVIAVVSYEIATGYMYLNTYSRLDNMHAMIMYYPTVNDMNNPSVEGLDFSIPEEEIKNMIESSYYVKYDANGGTGTMPTTVHSVDGTEQLAKNEFTKEGYIFAGWELTTEDGVSVLLDGQPVTNIGKPLQTVTLKALWTEDPNYDKDVVYTLTTKTGTISTSPGLTYSAVIEYRNRTADSIEIRVNWTTTIKKGSYTRYGQNFNFTIGSTKSENVKVLAFDTWKNSASTARSSTGTSGWITVPLNTASATTLSMKVYYWQTNSNNVDMYKYDGTECVNTTWTLSIPAN